MDKLKTCRALHALTVIGVTCALLTMVMFIPLYAISPEVNTSWYSIAETKKDTEVKTNTQYDTAQIKSKLQKKIKKEVQTRYEAAKPRSPRMLIVKYCEIYGVNSKLALGISKLETGNWTSGLFHSNNNFGGMMGSNGPLYFSSMDAGAKAFVKCVKWYNNKGMTTVSSMASVYCPDSPQSWASKVESLMMEEK